MTLQEVIPAESSYTQFIEHAVEEREVWGLRSPEGWAVCDSLDHTNRSVLPFWSNRFHAVRATVDDWADYEATPIPLSEFIDAWLVALAKKNCLVGTDWDAMNCGLEIEPAALAEDLRYAYVSR